MAPPPAQLTKETHKSNGIKIELTQLSKDTSTPPTHYPIRLRVHISNSSLAEHDSDVFLQKVKICDRWECPLLFLPHPRRAEIRSSYNNTGISSKLLRMFKNRIVSTAPEL